MSEVEGEENQKLPVNQLRQLEITLDRHVWAQLGDKNKGVISRYFIANTPLFILSLLQIKSAFFLEGLGWHVRFSHDIKSDNTKNQSILTHINTISSARRFDSRDTPRTTALCFLFLPTRRYNSMNIK